MRSTTIQAKIAAFESGNTRPPPSPTDNNSLIDLKDWVIDVNSPGLAPPKLPPRKPSQSSLKQAIHGTSPTTPTSPAPPAFLYPPRPFSNLDIESARALNPNNLSAKQSHVPSSSISSFHSVSLSSDTDPSTPGSMANMIATFPIDRSPNDPTHDADVQSLAESYEEVSMSSSIASPATERLIIQDWQNAMTRATSSSSLAKRKTPPAVPPKLPDRPASRKSITPTLPSLITRSPPPPPSAYQSSIASRSSVNGSVPPSPIIRPSNSSSSLTTTIGPPMIPTTYVPRRSAPPPPSSRASDRSSIQSLQSTSTGTTATTTHSFSSSSLSHTTFGTSSSNSTNNGLSHTLSLAAKTKRPTPVPLAARKRYEAVFKLNVVQKRKAEQEMKNKKPSLLTPGEARGMGRRAAGWRGLSVDLITVDDLDPISDKGKEKEDPNVDETVGPDDVLEAGIVKHIWKRSGLPKATLSQIWVECDPQSKGALSMDGFVKGMWRIDEDLRRAQAQAIKEAQSTSIRGYRSPPPPGSALGRQSSTKPRRQAPAYPASPAYSARQPPPAIHVQTNQAPSHYPPALSTARPIPPPRPSKPKDLLS
ncbi:hypothetical protein CVT24_012239 [Panaeolus cyanescens]|uniref:EH domain-containing protein n=1 Tax=Panaeolus cyanescens TaxID=181874 RepID=A0A409VYW7_9AGAR|nr:hypothetical protein CVT24_012239 [Panaeolus cyanescens]